MTCCYILSQPATPATCHARRASRRATTTVTCAGQSIVPSRLRKPTFDGAIGRARAAPTLAGKFAPPASHLRPASHRQMIRRMCQRHRLPQLRRLRDHQRRPRRRPPHRTHCHHLRCATQYQWARTSSTPSRPSLACLARMPPCNTICAPPACPRATPSRLRRGARRRPAPTIVQSMPGSSSIPMATRTMRRRMWGMRRHRRRVLTSSSTRPARASSFGISMRPTTPTVAGSGRTSALQPTRTTALTRHWCS